MKQFTKKFFLLIIGICFISSCNFLRKTRTEKITEEGIPQFYDGAYRNRINKHKALWPLLTHNKSIDSTGTVTFHTLDKNTLLIVHTGNNFVKDSFLVKGSLKDDGFHFKRRRRINGAFPLLWSYMSTSFTLEKTKKGEVVLSAYNFGFVGFIIPIIGSDGTHDLVLKRVSSTHKNILY